MTRSLVIPLLLLVARPAAAAASGPLPFAPRVGVVVAPHPSDIAVADLDRNGRGDFVTVHADSDAIWIALGRPAGDFIVSGPLSAGTAPRAVQIADVNRDTHLDLIVANAISNSVSVLLGRGDGTFEAARDTPVGHAPCGVAVADVDGNGTPDIAVANLFDDTVEVLLGSGDGTFTARRAGGGARVVHRR